MFQIDSVNVLARAHYMPAMARLGADPTAAINAMARPPAPELFECWAHCASLVPVADYQLFGWVRDFWTRRAAHHGAQGTASLETDLLTELKVRREPFAVGDVARREEQTGPWWGWGPGKLALERLYRRGEVVAYRTPTFARLYDLPERVLPASILGEPEIDEADARRELLRRSARSLGVFTLRDIADYYRQSITKVRPLLADLVEEGTALPVAIEGWRGPAYTHRDIKIPRAITARAFLSPFDPVVWERGRALRVFGLDYKIGIYTPAPQRTRGYYALPFLLGDEIVARTDLKAERKAKVLAVLGAWSEPGYEGRPDVAPEMAAALTAMAAWLGLDNGWRAEGPGDLMPALGTFAA